MAGALVERLVPRSQEYTAPLGIKVLAVWASLRSLPLVGFALFLSLRTLEHLSAAGIFGVLLSATVVLTCLGYAAFAGLTAFSLWNVSPNGIRGVVLLAAVSVFMSFLFLGTQDTVWILGFTPELYPLALLGLATANVAATYVLMNLVNFIAIGYVFYRREEFL